MLFVSQCYKSNYVGFISNYWNLAKLYLKATYACPYMDISFVKITQPFLANFDKNFAGYNTQGDYYLSISNAYFLTFEFFLNFYPISDLLNEGLPSNWKSYIWTLAHLSFLSVDLYLTHPTSSSSSDVMRPGKRQCTRRADLETQDRAGLLREALGVFWGRMEEITGEEGYSYSTTFLHR